MLPFIKNVVRKLRRISILDLLYIHLYKFWAPDISSIIAKYTPSDGTIIQIGSNDGKSGDPLYSFIMKNKKSKAIFVEPVPYCFNKLKAHYGDDPRFVFENAAVNNGSKMTFYIVKEDAKVKYPDLPYWYDQLGSFNRSHIANHLNGILDPYIEEVELQGISLDNLLFKYSIFSIDLLHIDTEGYDWEILKQLRLTKYFPRLIIFEHKHLSPSEKNASLAFLANDYLIFNFGNDYLSIKKEIINGLDILKLRTKLIK